jgi:dihydroorotase
MNPPLRTKDDVEAIKEGLRDGTIDVIASDHAPHTSEEKDVEFDYAPFGVIGMETLLAIMATELIDKGTLTWPQAIAKLTINPARLMNLPKGTLRQGDIADITIIDPDREWVINSAEFKSKSRNCPFHGWKVKAKAVMVIVNGEIRYSDPCLS